MNNTRRTNDLAHVHPITATEAIAARAIVFTWDGDVGTVMKVEGDDVHICFQDRIGGRGAYIYNISQVQHADMYNADTYIKRCDRIDPKGQLAKRDARLV